MLKRNGETCQYQVPNFAGRLTETEQSAYMEAIASVGEQLKQYNEAVAALSEVEKQMPQLLKLVPNSSSKESQILVDKESSGAPWQILRTFFKTSRNEVLFCARQSETGNEFGIIEKFDPNSAYAQAQGNCEVLMKNKNVHFLMRDYLENERAILQLFQNDIEANVEESLSENYPGQNLSRVVKAVGGRCNNLTPAASKDNRIHSVTNNVKIRF